jgi:hypothetical protein
VKQGDPLGPLYFALALQPVLERVAARTLTSPADTVLDRGHLLAFLDDVTMCAPNKRLTQAVALLRREALRIGLQLNAGKSYLLNAALTESPTGTAFSSTGVTTLGNGFGTDDYQRLTAVSTLQKHAKPLPYLRALKPQVVLPLLQACVNARPVSC